MLLPCLCWSTERRRLAFHALLIFIGCGLAAVDGLRLLQVQVPAEVERGRSAVLGCRFDMEGDTLYSVQWYKGGNEFFRVKPKDTPPMTIFKVEGVQVNLAASDKNQVVLENMTLKSEGRYKCEVSAESPNFQTVRDVSEMKIVVPPRDSPWINSPKTTYRIGEDFTANCSAFPSRPAATISWTIADKPVSNVDVIRYPSTLIDGGLEASVLGLKIRLRDEHFDHKGKMKLTCTASVGKMRIDGQTVVNISIADSFIKGDYPRQRSLTLDSRSGSGAGASLTSDRAQMSFVSWRYYTTIALVLTILFRPFG